MPPNLMAGALSALILQSRRVPRNKVLVGAVLSAFTPGVLGLALPLAIAAQHPRKPPNEPKDPADPDDGDGVVDLDVLPNVVGWRKEDAEARLKGRRMNVTLKPAELKAADRPAAPGTVVAQEPPGERSVPIGTEVLLYVQQDDAVATAE